MKPELSLITILLVCAIIAGCVSSGRGDISHPPVANNVTAANDSASQYYAEYQQGLEHNSVAKNSFDTATNLWEAGNYSEAAADYEDAQNEYNQASLHYGNMAQYALNQTGQDFSKDMCQCANLMSLASENFASSAGESGKNDTAAYDDFLEGQDFLNQSDALLNQSLPLMPPA